MKKILFSLLVLVGIDVTAQVKVGNNPTNVHSSAMLEVDSTTKGLLPPRMTQTQMNAIVTPATGLIIYCLDCFPAGLKVYGGTAWTSLVSSSSSAETQFTNLTNNLNSVDISWLCAADHNEPYGPVTGNISSGITNYFEEWNFDAFDKGGFIFVNSTSLADIEPSKLLPYTTNTQSTGGSVTTSSLLGGRKYFTNFSTNRKLFSVYVETDLVTSLKFVSDSGIDSEALDAITGSFLCSNGQYRCYYQAANRSSGNDSFLIHMFFVKNIESAAVTFVQNRADFGSMIGNPGPPDLDDYSARISWATQGQVSAVYGLIAVKSLGLFVAAAPTVAELTQLGNAFATILIP